MGSVGGTNASITHRRRARSAGRHRVDCPFQKGAVIYREGDSANAIFNIVKGVVTPRRKAPDGSEHIAAFLFPDDLFGLAEEGRYTNSMRALTPGDRVPPSRTGLTKPIVARCRAGISCYLQALSGTPSSSVSCVSAQPTKVHFEIGDVSAISRTTSRRKR
jgi:cyclic nucleotide-binding protein